MNMHNQNTDADADRICHTCNLRPATRRLSDDIWICEVCYYEVRGWKPS